MKCQQWVKFIVGNGDLAENRTDPFVLGDQVPVASRKALFQFRMMTPVAPPMLIGNAIRQFYPDVGVGRVKQTTSHNGLRLSHVWIPAMFYQVFASSGGSRQGQLSGLRVMQLVPEVIPTVGANPVRTETGIEFQRQFQMQRSRVPWR